MAVNRLFQILFLLLEKGGITAPELAERLEVSVRTIYRDIDTLSMAGIPVYTTQGKGGGIFIMENFVLNKSLISEQEQNQILLSLQGFGMVYEENIDGLLSKLGSIFNKQNVNWIEIDFSEWSGSNEDLFGALKDAIFKNNVVTFNYYSGKGQDGTRTADPVKLIFKSRDWYLYGYCHLREDYRMFKLSRMKELQVTTKKFVRSTPEKVLENINYHIGDKADLTLLFNKNLAYHVYEYFDLIEEREDGGYLVNVSLPKNESMFSFLLSFGDQAEVLAPPEIRADMKMRIEKMKEKYET